MTGRFHVVPTEEVYVLMVSNLAQSAVLDQVTPVYSDSDSDNDNNNDSGNDSDGGNDASGPFPPFDPLFELERLMDQMVEHVMEFSNESLATIHSAIHPISTGVAAKAAKAAEAVEAAEAATDGPDGPADGPGVGVGVMCDYTRVSSNGVCERSGQKLRLIGLTNEEREKMRETLGESYM